jgi:hypothetical protein
MNDPCGELVVRLGKAQVDAMFGRQDHGPILDDSEFLPLVESVLTAFETAGIDSEVVEELWAIPWSLAGGIAGVLVGPNLVAQERRPLGSFLGTIVGTCGGILYLAYERDQERALAGVSYGVFIGMVVGSGLLPALIGSSHLLPRMSSESDEPDEDDGGDIPPMKPGRRGR